MDRTGGRSRTALWMGGLLVVALLTWGVLVWFAIGEGRDLRRGDGSWPALVVASLAAMGCLYAALVLLVRLRRLRDAADRPAPPASGGRHLAR